MKWIKRIIYILVVLDVISIVAAFWDIGYVVAGYGTIILCILWLSLIHNEIKVAALSEAGVQLFAHLFTLFIVGILYLLFKPVWAIAVFGFSMFGLLLFTIWDFIVSEPIVSPISFMIDALDRSKRDIYDPCYSLQFLDNGYAVRTECGTDNVRAYSSVDIQEVVWRIVNDLNSCGK